MDLETAAARRWTTAAALGAGLWLAACALIWPINHDEGQYVAGALLARHARIFADFLYLQPPLHAWALMPVARLWPGHALTAMRLANAALALLTLTGVWATQRRLNVPPRTALVATGLLLACNAFLFGGSVARNDMLLTVLAVGAVYAAVRGRQDDAPLWWAGAGLLLGLAGSTKLLALPLLAALGIAALAEAWARRTPRAPVAVALGAGVGLAPAIAAALTAPDAFLYGVFTYGFTAPFHWYARTGQMVDLQGWSKAASLFCFLLVGPGLVALALIGRRARLTIGNADRRLVLLMAAAGLAAAALPTPAHRQYLLPALPLVAIVIGPLLSDAAVCLRWRAAAALFAAIGLAPSLAYLGHAALHGSPALGADEEARLIGTLVPGGSLASFSPERLAASARDIDPRFATGPFVYRSGGLLPDAAARQLRVVTPATLAAALDAVRPSGILTGYETAWLNGVPPPDAALAAYAVAHRYRLRRLPDGIGRLYIRPAG